MSIQLELQQTPTGGWIIHQPQFDTAKVIAHYSQKGEDPKYVCSTEQSRNSPVVDIYYTSEPNEQFGNSYFGLYHGQQGLMICNADWVEDFTFDMIQDEQGSYRYSQHVHDYVGVKDNFIDGGREYTRTSTGDVTTFKVSKGEFIKND